MSTTAVAAILLGLAAPSFQDLSRAHQARAAVQQLSSLLSGARAEAERRNVVVLVCPSGDGATCLASPPPASWSGLTIACVDADDDGACDAATATAPNPIGARSPVETAVQLFGPAAVVRFNGRGQPGGSVEFSVRAGPAASQSGTITVAATGTVRAF